MVARVTLGRRRSWSGQTRRFRIARAALALSGRVLFRRSNLLAAGAVEPRDPAMQQRALRHSF
jgi:hypothetical protein